MSSPIMANTQAPPTKQDSANGSQLTEEDAPPPVFPPMMQSCGLTLYGIPLMPYPVEDDPVTHIKNIRSLRMRHDDVIIAAYPKSGTHWAWEVVQMLHRGQVQYEHRTKESAMIEFNTVATLDKEKSPRVLNSHLWTAHLPKEIVEKKIKIVHVVRNPKDTFVSMFHHMKQEGTFTLGQFLNVYMNNTSAIRHQFMYLRQMEEFQKEHPEVPIKIVYYEEMKKEPERLTWDIAKFLNISVSEEFCTEVAKACSFEKMKAFESGQMDKQFPEMKGDVLKDASKIRIYRKGTVGGWKNELTVVQNELFDSFIGRESQGLTYTFVYE